MHSFRIAYLFYFQNKNLNYHKLLKATQNKQYPLITEVSLKMVKAIRAMYTVKQQTETIPLP